MKFTILETCLRLILGIMTLYIKYTLILKSQMREVRYNINHDIYVITSKRDGTIEKVIKKLGKELASGLLKDAPCEVHI